MSREVPLELEVARSAYLAALNRWLSDRHRHEVYSRSRVELAAAGRHLRLTLRELGIDPHGRMPPPATG